MDDDPNMTAEIALCWALNAKNSLENYLGFSPFQLVFGESPKLPSVFTAGPPGFEEVVMSKSVAEHINALHAAREAFIKCEADKVLKQALKSRIYTQGQDISVGDWIYFKNLRKWEGPVKITTCDGKLLYAVRNGRLLTINSDHATLARFEGEFIDNPSLAVSGEDVPEQTVNNEVPQLETGQQIVSRENVEQAVEDNVAGQHDQEDDNNSQIDLVNNDMTSGEVLKKGEHHDQEELPPRPTPSKIDKCKLREKDVIPFIKYNEEG